MALFCITFHLWRKKLLYPILKRREPFYANAAISHLSIQQQILKENKAVKSIVSVYSQLTNLIITNNLRLSINARLGYFKINILP